MLSDCMVSDFNTVRKPLERKEIAPVGSDRK